MSTYTQTGPYKVVSPLGGDTLLFSGMSGEEAVSTPFLFTVDMLSEKETIVASQMLRKSLTIELDMGSGQTRYINGLVRRFIEMDSAFSGLYAYRVEIVPWFWFLSLAADCRVYENKSVPDIVEDVFKRNNWTDFTLQTTGTYAPREYCVQYRETDLAFVSRLLEEEGIFYFFQHTDSKHTLVMADGNSAFQPVPGTSTISASEQVAGSTQYQQSVGSIQWDQHVLPGTVTLYDYNYLDGQKALTATVSSSGPEEIYDYPGGFTDQDTGDRYARAQLDAAEAFQQEVTGVSSCMGFTAGYQFTLSDYFRSDLNGGFNLVKVRHTAQLLGYYGAAAAADQTATYQNDFRALAKETVFRPDLRTPRPVICGTQTALVVGPSGSEINVDKYGRVQVQFFWERTNKGDPGSSPFVRVSTSWAGKNWGIIHIPRIGQEVVVAFEEGNPDRPIIVGSVYNPDMMPPYDLPANKSQSGIKSRSTEGGGTSDYNELRFEDKMGSEEIHLHAQKDLRITVENNRTEYIGNAETKIIDKGDYNELLKEGKYVLEIQKGDQEIDIDQGSQKTTLGQGDCSLDLEMGGYDIDLGQGDMSTSLTRGNVSTKLDMGNYELEASMGNVSIKTDLGQVTIEALQGIELKVGPNSIKIDMSGVTISGLMVSVSGQVQTQVSGLMTQVSGSAMTQISGAITMIG
jgi:type VI secretion system secreted protein VgrG